MSPLFDADTDDPELPDCVHQDADEDEDDLILIERVASIFRALGDSSRIRTIRRLAKKEACVSELAAESGVGLSTVSQRLRLMRSERLVKKRREGKHIYYSLEDDHILEIIQCAFDHAREEG